jgi:hypothetical protein
LLLVQRHSGTLQIFDMACQILNQLRSALGSADKQAAIDRVTALEFKQRPSRTPLS